MKAAPPIVTLSKATRPAQASANLPVMLTGLLVFAGGLALQVQWLSFLGIVFFIAANMSHHAPQDTGETDERLARTQAAIRLHREIRRNRAIARVRGQTRVDDTAADFNARPAAFSTGEDHLVPVFPDRKATPRSGKASASAASAIRHRAYFPAPGLELRPITPLHGGVEMHSWFGGHPRMPDAIDWPEPGGRPARFLAQVSCAHLPPDIWHGKGPRSGWLLFFQTPSHVGQAAVLHSPELGAPRQPPEPSPSLDTSPVRMDILHRATGRFRETPGWPIGFHTSHRRAQAMPEPMLAQDPPDPADPLIRPFDWGSAMVLVEVVLADLDWRQTMLSALFETETSVDTSPRQAFLDRLAATRSGTEALKTELTRARQNNLPFSDGLRDLVLQGLAGLKLHDTDGAGIADAELRPLLEHARIRHDYANWVEQYAKQIYCETPHALPHPQRTLFQDIWAQQAARSRAILGGNPPDHIPATSTKSKAPVQLIRVPSNPLIGWEFGKGGAFAVFLDPDALARGDFSKAYGETLG